MRVQNLHGLALSGFPLGIACTTCGHRALVEAAKVGARDGNMTEIHQLKLRRSECDGRAFEGTIFSAQDQVNDFLAVVSKGGGRPDLSRKPAWFKSRIKSGRKIEDMPLASAPAANGRADGGSRAEREREQHQRNNEQAGGERAHRPDLAGRWVHLARWPAWSRLHQQPQPAQPRRRRTAR